MSLVQAPYIGGLIFEAVRGSDPFLGANFVRYSCFGILVLVFAALGLLNVEEVRAQAGFTCGATTDANARNSGWMSGSTTALTNTPGTCNAVEDVDPNAIGSFPYNGATALFVLNDTYDNFDRTYEVRIFLGSVASNVRIDGSPIPNSYTISHDISDSIDSTIRFEVGGKDYQFEIHKSSFQREIASFTVVLANDPPTITSDGGGATANVSFPENQTTVTNVQTSDDSDSEGSGLTYAITGGTSDRHRMGIHPTTGVLSMHSPYDFEVPADENRDNIFEVEVTVTDSGGKTDVQYIYAQLTDVVENTAPTFQGITASTVGVGVPEGGTFIDDFQGVDDNDSEGSGLTFSLTGSIDDALFSINPDTGYLAFKNPPDFEAPQDVGNDNIYNLQVRLTDSGGLFTEKNFVITVQDVVEDAVSPQAEIQNAPKSHDGKNTFNVTIEFSEDITGFNGSDVVVTNGRVTAYTPTTGGTYTVTILPDGPQEITIDVPAGVVKDLAGNDNLAATQVTISGTAVETTRKAISNLIQNRASHILGNQPNLTGFMNGTRMQGGWHLGRLGISGNEGSQILSFATSRSRVLARKAQSRVDEAFQAVMPTAYKAEDRAVSKDGQQQIASIAPQQAQGTLAPAKMRAGDYDIWTEIYAAHSKASQSRNNLFVGYLGAHYFVTDHLLLGMVGQLDFSRQKNKTDNSKSDGLGWMVGPYIVGQLPDQKLFYEMRASWGRSNNKISPLGTYEDSFETERWMASAKISGLFEYEGFKLIPETSLSYFQETQLAYTDSLSNRIASQTISLGEVRMGPKISKQFALGDTMTLEPSLGTSGVYNFARRDNKGSQGHPLGSDSLRARLDAGFSLLSADGMEISGAGYYDGLGVEDYHSYGGKLRLIVPLN